MKITKKDVKKFVADNKKGFIICSAVGAAFGTVYAIAYGNGLNQGIKDGLVAMACAVYTDNQGAASMVDEWIKINETANIEEITRIGQMILEKGIAK